MYEAYQALETIFAIFGVGCFLAGILVASIVIWAYLELKKEPSGQESCEEDTGKIVVFRRREEGDM